MYLKRKERTLRVNYPVIDLGHGRHTIDESPMIDFIKAAEDRCLACIGGVWPPLHRVRVRRNVDTSEVHLDEAALYGPAALVVIVVKEL